MLYHKVNVMGRYVQYGPMARNKLMEGEILTNTEFCDALLIWLKHDPSVDNFNRMFDTVECSKRNTVMYGTHRYIFDESPADYSDFSDPD